MVSGANFSWGTTLSSSSSFLSSCPPPSDRLDGSGSTPTSQQLPASKSADQAAHRHEAAPASHRHALEHQHPPCEQKHPCQPPLQHDEAADVLKAVYLDVEPGQLLLVCGPVGAGKSSLLQVSCVRVRMLVLARRGAAGGGTWGRGVRREGVPGKGGVRREGVPRRDAA